MPEYNNTSVGRESYDTYNRKFGRCTGISAESVIWDGPNVYDGWLANEEDVEWSSSNPLDAPGGAGVSLIQFTGQGKDGIEKTYRGTINGTTWTKLSSTDPGVLFDIIYTTEALNIGGTNLSPLISAGCANIGTITIRSVTTQKTMAIIKPNNGRSEMLIWRCPSNYYGEFKRLEIYPQSGKPVICRIMVRYAKTLSWICVGIADLDSNLLVNKHVDPTYIPPGMDICVTAVPAGVGTNVSGQWWTEVFPIDGVYK